MLFDFKLNLLTLAYRVACKLRRTIEGEVRLTTTSRRRQRLDQVEALESRELLTTYTVTTAQDVVNPNDSVTSLREAIALANSSQGADTIQFSPAANGTISLNFGVLNITDKLTIQGNGTQQTIVDAHNASRVLNFSNPTGDLTLNGLTVTRGYDIGNAGGINFDSTGTLSVDNCVISQNTANYGGGGIYAFLGAVTITNSTISENKAGNYYRKSGGGGIAMNFGVVTLLNSTVSGNSVDGHGGGVAVATGELILKNTTIAQNLAHDRSANDDGGFGGGLYANNVAVTLSNSTVAFNLADGSKSGGGIYIAGTAAMLTARNSIIAQNNPPSGSYSDINRVNSITLTLKNTLLGSNVSTNLTASSSPDTDGNLIGTANLPIDPLLGQLGNNGGPTQTLNLQANSPALNLGSNTLASNAGLTTDQRGQPRVYNGTVDMGAFESQPFTIVVDTNQDSTNANDGVTSLREALELSNTMSGTQRIAFSAQANGTILLQQGTLQVKDSVIFDGNGSSQTIIDGNNASRVMTVSSPGNVNPNIQLTINELTVTHGSASLEVGGGIAFQQAGTLTGNKVTISDNTAYSGGGVHLPFEGEINLTNSTISGNTAVKISPGYGGEGGGISSRSAPITLVNCTVAGNGASHLGGGLAINTGHITLINCTVAANFSFNGIAGGILFSRDRPEDPSGTLTAKNSIIAQNIAATAPDLYVPADKTTLSYTFVGTNDGTELNYSGFPDADGNILPDANGNLIGTPFYRFDPLLKGLALNGGATKTMGLAVNSPAINRGSNSIAEIAGLVTDQRGLPRNSGSIVDMGAVEYQINTVTFETDASSIFEDDDIATVLVKLSFAADQDLVIPFSISGTATQPEDYSISSSILTIIKGSTQGVITIPIVDLVGFELPETVVLTLGHVAGATLGAITTTTVTIRDVDPVPSVDFAIAAATADEDSGTYLVTLKLFEVSGADVTVPFKFSGTASNPSDYTVATSSVVIPAGQLEATFGITIVDSSTNEPPETVILEMGLITNGVPGQVRTMTLTIVDVLPKVTFNAATSAVNENAGTVNLTVNLSKASDVNVTVPFTLSGTAGKPGDYGVSVSQIVISAGQTSANIPVAIVNDTLLEANETVILSLGTPTNATIGTTSVHTLTINANDSIPTVSFQSADPLEVSEDQLQSVALVVNLSVASDVDVTIPYTISGTATSVADYVLPAAPLVIPAGQSSGTINLLVKQDELIEDNETVIVTLGTPTNGTSGAITATTVRIINTDVNHAPIIQAGQVFTLPENSVSFTVVGQILASDSDQPSPYNLFSFVTPNIVPGQAFSIDSAGQIKVLSSSALDYEATHSFTIYVTVSDGGLLTSTEAITIQLTDVNEAPTITSSNTSSVAENVNTVLTVVASDPDEGQSLSYSISSGIDADRFAIDTTTGVLTFKNTPDFEAPADSDGNNVYNVTVRATDNGANNPYATQDLTITVTNVNEAPAITSASTVSVAENSTVVLTVTATDPDVQQTLTFSIQGGADVNRFDIDPTSGALTFKAAPDFENPSDADGNNSYQVIVKVTDNGSGNLSATRAVTVTVTNVNETPALTSSSTASVVENVNAVMTVMGLDPDVGQLLSYSISAGDDAGKFAIDTATGVLTFINAPDFEAPADTDGNNVYNVTVQATDNGAGNLFVIKDLSITVTNVNEAPEITTASSVSVSENSTAVLTVAATDPDAQQTLIFSIQGGLDANKFDINPTSGALAFAAAPNFESPSDTNGDNVYQVIVKVGDKGPGNLSATKTLTVTVTNLNEAPTITSSNTARVAENVNAVMTVVALDPDIGQSLSYSISGGVDAIHFAVDATTGELTFGTAPDFEMPADADGNNDYNVTVQVIDNGTGNLFATRDLEVTVTKVNEPPIVSEQTFFLTENAAANTIVGTIQATDPENAAISYTIVSSSSENPFVLNATTGELKVIGPQPNLDFETTPVYTLQVRVSDAGNHTTTQTITVNLTNVSEPAVIGGGVATATFTKNGAAASLFPNLTLLFPEGRTQLGTVVISYSVLKKGNPADVGFANPTGLGTLTISGPTSFKTAAGTRTLTLVLNSSATVGAVQDFLRSFRFATKDFDPARKNLGRQIDVQIFGHNGTPSNKLATQMRASKKK